MNLLVIRLLCITEPIPGRRIERLSDALLSRSADNSCTGSWRHLSYTHPSCLRSTNIYVAGSGTFYKQMAAVSDLRSQKNSTGHTACSPIEPHVLKHQHHGPLAAGRVPLRCTCQITKAVRRCREPPVSGFDPPSWLNRMPVT